MLNYYQTLALTLKLNLSEFSNMFDEERDKQKKWTKTVKGQP